MGAPPRPLEFIAGGWSVNGIATLRTGEPMSVTARNNLLNTGTNNFATKTCDSAAMPKRVDQWFDTTCFNDLTEPYKFGDASTGVLRGPGVVNFDVSVFKGFQVREKIRTEFRAEFFNALNNAHFANPNTQRANANYGRITSTILTPREIQLGLKLSF
jgi:hypothetical protein